MNGIAKIATFVPGYRFVNRDPLSTNHKIWIRSFSHFTGDVIFEWPLTDMIFGNIEAWFIGYLSHCEIQFT